MKNPKVWQEYQDKNIDDYGKACIDVARKAMEILDEGKPFDAHELMCQADHEALGKNNGITGFMAGCIARIIYECHERGEEFNTAWNKSYGITGNEGGTVNPAIMTVNVPLKGED